MPSIFHSNQTPILDRRYLERDQPVPSFISMGDHDDLPSDWYLRICGFAAAALKGGPRLEKELPQRKLLMDSSHSTHSEGPSSARRDGSASGQPVVADSQSVAHSVPAANSPLDDLPPPPYTLEAESGDQQANDSDLAATMANVALSPSPSGVRPGLVSTLSGVTHATTASPSIAMPSQTPVLNIDASSTAPSKDSQIESLSQSHTTSAQSMP